MENKKELNSKNLLAAMGAMMQMEFSIPYQEQMLYLINGRIGEIRADIISGDKTEDEMNTLLDSLQRLSVKKADMEAKIGSIRHMRELCEKLNEKEVDVTGPISGIQGKEFIKKLLNKTEEEP